MWNKPKPIPGLGVIITACLLQLASPRDVSVPWEPFKQSMYRFFYDAHKEVDKTRYGAEWHCKQHGARLITIETEEELTYIQERIRELVVDQGQQFAHEEWWTGGLYTNGQWMWDDGEGGSPVQFHVTSHTQRSVADDPVQYIALVHDERTGWKFKRTPANYKLRYICEKKASPGLLPAFGFDTQLPEELLMAQLFRHYDLDARGTRNPRQALQVQMQLHLLRVIDLDVKNMVLTTSGVLILDWVDERLVWDPQHYDNISRLVVRAARLWLPEVSLLNRADEEYLQEPGRTRAVLGSTGSVHWESVGLYRTSCIMDISAYPFDQHTCLIKVGSLAYGSSLLNITNSSSQVALQEYTLNGDWSLVSTSQTWSQVTWRCCMEPHSSFITFSLTLKRRHLYQVINIILPCILLSVLSLTVFCVPPHSGEKLSVAVAILLTFTVFLLMVADGLPKTSNAVPIIVLYLTSTLILVVLVVVIAVIVLKLHHNGPVKPIPSWAKRLVSKHSRSGFPSKQKQSKDGGQAGPSKTEVEGLMTKEYMDYVERLEGPSSDETKLKDISVGQNHANHRLQEDVITSRWPKPPRAPDIEHCLDLVTWQDFAAVVNRVGFGVVLTLLILVILLTLIIPYSMSA